jgi:hypothetical protein
MLKSLCYRVERTSLRAQLAPAEVQRLFTAHWYGAECHLLFNDGGNVN